MVRAAVSDILDAARQAVRAGLNVLPPRQDGSKAPAVEWARCQTEMVTEAEILDWWGRGSRTGLGLVCGPVSGGLEMLEFEGRAVEAGLNVEFLEAADAAGLGDLLDRVVGGYLEETPAGGRHLFWRCSEVEGNQKLARRPATAEELAENPDDKVKVLIETRGRGGFAIVAPSDGTVHPTGRPWRLLQGGFESIATITPEERTELLRLARSFDRMPISPITTPLVTGDNPRESTAGGWIVRPGDDFAARTTWADLLEPEGWRAVYERGGEVFWRRPGKADGISATTNRDGSNNLFVFSTSTVFEEEKPYTLFGAFARLYHGDDYKAAARALEDKGYGQRAERDERTEVGSRLTGTNGDRVGTAGSTPATEDPTDDAFFVDWPAFWARVRLGPDWLFDDVLARGRGHAIYASHKTGKSLLMLWLAVEMARRGVAVVYLDFEMGDDDLFERLADMGYGPATDLSFLHYAVLPSLPPLDTEQGASVLLAKVDAVIAAHPGVEVAVVIDTTARAVAGEENSADTFRDFYRFTGTGFKRRGVTWARLDHAGKDTAKGQRGSSAKGDDVDVVWRLARTDNGLELRREASRMGWVPLRVAFRQLDEPLRFVRVDEDWPAGTAEVARILDDLEVPPRAGERPAGQALREAGHQAGQYLVRAAQKYRRQVAEQGHR